MDTFTNLSPSLRVNSKSKFKKPKRVSGKNKKEKQHTFTVWTEFMKLSIDEEGSWNIKIASPSSQMIKTK